MDASFSSDTLSTDDDVFPNYSEDAQISEYSEDTQATEAHIDYVEELDNNHRNFNMSQNVDSYPADNILNDENYEYLPEETLNDENYDVSLGNALYKNDNYDASYEK